MCFSHRWIEAVQRSLGTEHGATGGNYNDEDDNEGRN